MSRDPTVRQPTKTITYWTTQTLVYHARQLVVPLSASPDQIDDLIAHDFNEDNHLSETQTHHDYQIDKVRP